MDFRYLAETNALVVVLAGGDIVVVNLEDYLLSGQEKVKIRMPALLKCSTEDSADV